MDRAKSGCPLCMDRRQDVGRVGTGPADQLQALEEQIRKLREMRQRWAKGEGLTEGELLRQELTLELLDGAIQDLIVRRNELLRLEE